MALTDRTLRSLKPADKPRKLSDGGGLHVLLTPQGSRLWRMAYRFGGKQKTLSFGAWPAVSLIDARARRGEAKRILAAGKDPAQQARLEKIEQQIAVANTFGAVAEELLAKNAKEGRAAVTLAKKRWLLDMVLPHLGNRPIAEITAPEVLLELRKTEKAGHYETARRLRAFVGQVFRYAIATARADNDPTFALRDALITPQVTHRAALIDWEGFGGLIRAIWAYPGNTQTAACLKLMALTYPRPGELRMARWEEFDLAKAIWTIPAARTKMRREHHKPLSELACSILHDLHNVTGHRELVFPSARSPRNPLSENTMNQAIRRMGFEGGQMTSHGFRASASSLLNESGLWNGDAIEAELAHVDNNMVRRAYHRSQYWEERVRMCAWWADQIEAKLADV